jgi:hypothetical protein
VHIFVQLYIFVHIFVQQKYFCAYFCATLYFCAYFCATLYLGEEPFAPYERYIARNIQIRDRHKHRQLLADLIEHISQFHGTR